MKLTHLMTLLFAGAVAAVAQQASGAAAIEHQQVGPAVGVVVAEREAIALRVGKADVVRDVGQSDRHVAFGVLSLKEVYDGMTDAEMMERQEFAFEAAIRMRDRFLQQEVWEKHGVNPKDVMPLVLNDPTRDLLTVEAPIWQRLDWIVPLTEPLKPKAK